MTVLATAYDKDVISRCSLANICLCTQSKKKIYGFKLFFLIRQLKALVFMQAVEESAEWALLSTFCNDSSMHISIFK